MRRTISYIFVLMLFTAVACNFPLIPKPVSPDHPEIPGPEIIVTQPGPSIIIQTPIGHPLPPPFDSQEYDPSISTAYSVQSGDTLRVVAAHFGVDPAEISSKFPLPSEGLLPNGQILIIPKLTEVPLYTQFLLPDSEIVNSPCGRNFDIHSYVASTNGRLRNFNQDIDSHLVSGSNIVKLVSGNTSINPHFLLAFIEFRSHWVLADSGEPDPSYPLRMENPNIEGLFRELTLAAKLLNMGYYGWRQGTMTDLTFVDGSTVRISPDLNAGTVAIQYLFSRLYHQSGWEDALYGPNGFLSTYQNMFGDPLACAQTIEPLFPDGLQVPVLELPFAPGEKWSLTGGLHIDWTTGTPLGALDFSPITGEPPCAISYAWVQASAPGIVTRSQDGVLLLSLVDDGGNSTGWDLLYMHLSQKDRAAVGTLVNTNDRIGHPSCEGGVSTGTHIHLARIFRGEWIGAGNPFPLVLSDWMAMPGEKPYQSTLVKGDQVVTASPYGSRIATIIRD